MRLNDHVLLIMSLCIAVFGLVCLVVLSFFSELPSVSVESSFLDMGAYSAQGRVFSVRSSDTVSSFMLSYECSLPVIVFSSLNIHDGDNVSVEGSWDGDDFVAEEVFIHLK